MFTFNELCELFGWTREETLKFIQEGIEKGTVKWKHKYHSGISYPIFDIEDCFEDSETDSIGDPSELTEWLDFDPDC